MKRCTPLSAASLLRHVLAGDVETSTCGLCLCDESLVPFSLPFSLDSTSSISIAQLINDLNIFESGDFTAKKVCKCCIQQLKKFHNFRQQCLNSSTTLRNVVKILDKQITIVSSQSVDLLSNDPDKSYTDCTLNISIDLDAVYANQLECGMDHWMAQRPKFTPSPKLQVPQILKRRTHLSEDNDVDSQIICTNCDTNFKNLLTFEKHTCQQRHNNPKKRFKDINEDLKDEGEEHHTKTSRLKTSKLGKNQRQKVTFQICKKYRSPNAKKPLPTGKKKSLRKEKHVCTYCDGAFASKSKLNLHIVRIHSEQEMSVERKTPREQNGSHVAPLDHTVKTEVLSDSIPLNNSNEDSNEGWFDSYFPEESKSLRIKKTKTALTRKSENIDNLRNKSGLFECRKCYFDFETIMEWKQHQEDHGNTFLNLCRICDEKFHGFSSLVSHFTTSHPDQTLPTSMLNIKTFQYKQCICSHCNQTFRSKGSLLSHMRRHHKEHLKSFVCNVCNRKYVHNHKCRFTCNECRSFPCIHEKYLLSYLNAERVMPKSKKKCIDCEYKYVRKHDLIDHVNKKHLLISPHMCLHCGRKFSSLMTLHKHKSNSHPQKCCPHCNKPLSNALLGRHIAVCKDLEKHFQCGICDQLFASMESAEKHRKSHISGFSCRQCNIKFESRNLLTDHKKTQCRGQKATDASKDKPQRVMWPCLKCPMDFISENESIEHELSHPLEWEYLCRGCSQRFPTKAERLECMRTHIGNATQVCPICGRLFQQFNLKLHLKRHHLKGEVKGLPNSTKRKLPKTYMCDICGSMHSLALNMRKHKEKHKSFVKCEYCLKFIEKGNMKKHLYIHKGAPKRFTRTVKLSCKECDFTTGLRHVLEGHLNRVHRKIRPNKCEVCGKMFFSVANLNSHFYGSHSKKNLHCAECNKTCRSSKGFKLHMMQHRGQLPHSCEHCNMKFVSACRKNEHLNRVHLARVYPCSLCEKVYTHGTTLKKHMLEKHENGKLKKSTQSKRRKTAMKKVPES